MCTSFCIRVCNIQQLNDVPIELEPARYKRGGWYQQ
jgi:hypothetical protein